VNQSGRRLYPKVKTMEDDNSELVQFGHAVLKLLKLYTQAHVQFDRAALRELNVHIELVRVLALNAVIPPATIPFPEVR
jgi:hypothetical protein